MKSATLKSPTQTVIEKLRASQQKRTLPLGVSRLGIVALGVLADIKARRDEQGGADDR